jgi:hypothetical protein
MLCPGFIHRKIICGVLEFGKIKEHYDSNISMIKNNSFSMMTLQKRPSRLHERAGLSNGGNVSI